MHHCFEQRQSIIRAAVPQHTTSLRATAKLMPDKFYDTLMRVPIIAYTIFFVVRELNGLRQIIGQHPTFDHDLGFIFNLAARISVLQFMR